MANSIVLLHVRDWQRNVAVHAATEVNEGGAVVALDARDRAQQIAGLEQLHVH